MLDLPEHPLLDKDRLIGGCVRLDLRFDPRRLADEIAAIPASFWGSKAGRLGVQDKSEAIFLRGFAPSEGDLPIENRPALVMLPYVRELIRQVEALPMRCLLARLAGGGAVPLHIDRAPYFGKTLRLHFPVETNPRVVMLSHGRRYHLREGEVWALNNSTAHAVLNGDPQRKRTHLICDFLPSESLVSRILRGERDLGVEDLALEQALQPKAPAQAS